MKNKKQKSQMAKIRSVVDQLSSKATGFKNITTLLRIYATTLFYLLLTANSYAGDYQITNIEVLDSAIKINANGPIKYKISETDDPFIASIDIEGLDLGRFTDKIYSSKSKVVEITPIQIKLPIKIARLNILLQSPSNIKPELKGDTLMLYIEESQRSLSDEKGTIAKEIVALLFDKTDDGVELIIKGDGNMPEPLVYELEKKVVLDIPDVLMKASLPSIMPYPIKDIKYKAEKGKTRFILDFQGKVDTDAVVLDDEIVVDISPKQNSEIKGKTKDLTSRHNNSNLVSMDFQDADIVAVLRLLADVSGYNIVFHPDIKGRITVRLLDVSWQQALDVVLKTFNLEKIVKGNIIRVVPRKVYEEEKKAEMEKLKAIFDAEATKELANMQTRVFVVNYADVETVKESISATGIAKKENISIDKRTRSVIVKETPSNLKEVERLISAIDKTTPQVLIEAKIVEMNTSFTRDLGIQWGLQWLSSNWRNSVLGSAAPPLPGGQLPTAINIPALEPTSAITFGYLNAAQTFGLDLRLSAAEKAGKANIISSPRIMTIENEKAEITHGIQVPVVTPGTANNPPTVTYKDANLKLIVTPSVTPEDTVFLNIEITNDVPDFRPERAISGNVPIDKREAKNKVLVRNGETVVIGGILRSREDEGEDRVPGISRIPILGWLFKRELKKTESQELVIFITPRIVR